MNVLEGFDALWCRDRKLFPMKRRRTRTRVFSLMVLLSAMPIAMAQNGQQNGQPPSNGSSPAQDPGPGRAWAMNPQIVIPETQSGTKNPDAANEERRKQITEDTARLLKMATDLKAEVDKTTKDTLSLGVIRKADEIEKLAHAVKEKMKLTPGSK